MSAIDSAIAGDEFGKIEPLLSRVDMAIEYSQPDKALYQRSTGEVKVRHFKVMKAPAVT